MITINISGPDKSGKGHAIATIANHLKTLGCEVIVQCENTHNASKLQQTDTDHAERLAGIKVVITEYQTSL